MQSQNLLQDYSIWYIHITCDSIHHLRSRAVLAFEWYTIVQTNFSKMNWNDGALSSCSFAYCLKVVTLIPGSFRAFISRPRYFHKMMQINTTNCKWNPFLLLLLALSIFACAKIIKTFLRRKRMRKQTGHLFKH